MPLADARDPQRDQEDHPQNAEAYDQWGAHGSSVAAEAARRKEACTHAGGDARPTGKLALVEASAGFHEGQKIWVLLPNGDQRPAIFVGEGENASWFGGPPLAYIVFADDRSSAEVQLDTIVPRDE